MISLDKKARIDICQKYIEQGVIIIDIDSTYIENTVSIGNGTVIYPNNYIEGETIIGKDCIIGPNNRIINTVIANGVNIQSSYITDSKIGDKCEIGPFAHIRPNNVLNNSVKVGAFVELKNSNIDDETHVAHLTYIGDSDVGKKVNFGCGTTIANYNGVEKNRCIIEDKCFIGCNTNLVSPVTLKEATYTAAGTTVTKDTKEYSLIIGRPEEIMIEGWAKGKYKNQ
ncbi:MAG: hypothetical protein PHH22_02590 [Clostridia bacterium]|nr:hypothetical protein [Clostridia bacterium]